MVEYNMVYPTNRWVSEDFIRMKYSDAVANGEVEYTDLTDLDEIIDELMDSGQVTFTTKTRENELARVAVQSANESHAEALFRHQTSQGRTGMTDIGVLHRSRRTELVLSVVKAHLELAVFWSKLPEGGPAELDERTVKYLLGVLTEEAISTTSPMGCDDEEI